MKTVKHVYKKTLRHWQHKDGCICVATWKPSSEWRQITKKQYGDLLAQQSVRSDAVSAAQKREYLAEMNRVAKELLGQSPRH